MFLIGWRCLCPLPLVSCLKLKKRQSILVVFSCLLPTQLEIPDENLIFFPVLAVLYNLCKVWLAGQQTCGLWGKITQFKYLFLWPNIKQLVFRILWQVDVYTLLVWREWDVNQKKQMCFGGSLCKASRLAGGCCTLFFPCLFVYHNVILMLWIVICEPEIAWGWSTCCEED